MKNRKVYFIVSFFILLLVISAVIYLKMLHKTKDELIAEKYAHSAKVLQNRIHDMIVSKQKATLSLALTLAHMNKNLSNFIENKNIPRNYYKTLLLEYKKDTFYKNIWIQILDKQGTSLYRSWSAYHGDNLLAFREDIRQMLHKPQSRFSISVGKFDLSIKAMVPVFDEKNFIGMLEVVSHFNSIAEQLRQNGIDSVVLADKKYKKRLQHPFTKFFVGDYYVANKDVKSKLLNYLKEYGVTNYLDNGYKIENGYFIVSYVLKNNDKVVGTYITFEKTDDLSLKNINDFVMQWILFGILSLMAVIGLINIVLYIILRKQKKYYQNIVDGSTNIVLVNDAKQIIEANKTFFQFFSEYKSVKEFTKQYQCICEFFVKSDGYIKKEMEGLNWVEYIKKYPEKDNKIKMRIKEKIYYFSVSASIISEKPLKNAIVLSNITKQEIYKHELEKMTITDPLTNIKNRRYYEQRIQKEISRSCRYKEPLSLIIFDIDHFKQVNDTYGHEIGDTVLIEYTRLISTMLRETDELCRIGGEEFVIITPHTTRLEAYKMAEKIRKAVSQYKGVVPITLSFGVSECQDCENKDSLFKRTDQALYEAKNSGRNKVVIG
jgi:diguanylate cyclase (GGDEF)-like protein